MEILGIDIGGSGIKGAPVNTDTGELLADRYRIPTPQPSKPDAVAEVVGDIARKFGWQGPIGAGFPAIVRHGTVYSAANVHKKWIGTNGRALFETATGCPVRLLNDADAAGMAEMAFGAGQGYQGVALMVTIGTGLGSALFIKGILVPNCEFGHIILRGKDAELSASDAARKANDLSWKKWGKHFNAYLERLEALMSPDRFILGGGVSKQFDHFKKYITVHAEVVPAMFLNEAGIVGAALAALDLTG